MKVSEQITSSDPERSLSPSVQRLVSELSGTPVHAGTVLQFLFEQHPEYAGKRAGSAELGEIEQGPEQPVEEWIKVAWSKLEEAEVGKLDGPLLTVCLAVEETTVGRTLAEVDGFLESLEKEIEGPLEVVLIQDAYDRWESLTGRVGESVPVHPDAPARVDELNRKPFARIVANRIKEVRQARRTQDDAQRAFMVHLHGKWGSGKTSVLNFMRDELTDDEWIVVDFNGWRYQRLNPPWWMLIKEVYRQGRCQVSGSKARRLQRRWWWWKFKSNWLPAGFVVAGVSLTSLLLYLVFNSYFYFSEARSIELIPGIVSVIVTASVTFYAATRSLMFGSSRAAKTYEEISQDPLVPIKRLFNRLIDTMGRPVAIFIDDLDRCEGEYVVNLLEGIQTLFRDRPVTYVVAADRQWIRTSFEEDYQPFEGSIEEPGRPLGYLFLDKVFQLPVAIPRLPRGVQDRFWGRLLKEEAPTAEERKEKEKKARELMKDKRTQDELRDVIAEHEDDEYLQKVLRARAAEKITSPEAREEIEHRLEPFSGFLEPNPRTMKRLVNAYGMKQAVNFLEWRDAGFEPLVLWTILSRRWPALRDLLAERPGYVDYVINQEKPEGNRLDPAEKALFVDEAVYEVVKGRSGDGDVVLDEPAIRSIVGYEGDEQSEGTR